MLQRYKLRLGDGTVLGVDHEGLRTWALDGKAMVQAADSHQWYPLKEFLAAEYIAARRAARQKASALPAATPRPLPLVYPKPREDKATPPPVPEPSELPPFIAESSEVQVLAGPPAGPPTGVAEEAGVPDLALPGVPIAEPLFEPIQDEEAVDAPARAEDEAEAAAMTAEPMVAPAPGGDPMDEPILGEELTAAVGGDLEQHWIPDDGLVTPPLESRNDDVPTIAQAPLEEAQALLEEAQGPLEEEDQPLRPAPPVVEPPPEAPDPSPRPSFQVLADDLSRGGAVAVTEATEPDEELPIIPLKPLEEQAPATWGTLTHEESRETGEEAPPRGELEEKLTRWFVRGASAYDSLITGWIRRLDRRPRSPSAGVPSHERKPAPPIHELPTLRLADSPARAVAGHVYEPRRPLHGRFTKGTVVMGGLLVAGLIAVLGWEIWAPRAERLGQAIFNQIDRVKQSREQAQALQDATERLPHLAPQTIQLLMASSPTGILDPPELFRVASDAADRGVKTLPAEEVQELKQLLRELLKSLRPSERERIREYDAARVRRLVFPFEGRDVLEVFARGAYALPPESRERLQALFAKAIAAGLAGASPEAPSGAAPEP